MTQKRNKSTKGGAGTDKAADLSSRLAAASGNIERISADAAVRQNEQKKNLKKSESDARARARGSEKQQAAENRKRDEEAAQRLAEFEYAEDYRKKLQRDRRKAMAEAREAREAAEAKVREERNQQIAKMLEDERREAAERAERADAMLEILARSKPSEANGGSVNSDEPSEQEAPVEEEIIEQPEEDADVSNNDVTAFSEESDKPGESAEEEKADLTESAFILNIGDTEDTELKENEEAAPPAADALSESEEPSRGEQSKHDEVFIDEKNGKMLLNIDPDGSFCSGGYKEPVANQACYEQVKEEIVGEYPNPALSSNPVVAAIQTLGKTVYSTSTYKKYTDKSRAAMKDFKKISDATAERASGSEDASAAGAAMVESIQAAKHIVEIRCDNLRIAAKFAQKSKDGIADKLQRDIENYNSKIAEFSAYTGERLTRIPRALPGRILNGTGLEVLPELSYSERYIEYIGEYAGEKTSSYVITVGRDDEEPAVTRDSKKGTPGTYIVNPVIPALTAEELIRGTYIYDEESYKKYRGVAKAAGRKLDRALKDVTRGIDVAERESSKLKSRLEYYRRAIDRALEDMNAKLDEAKDAVYRKALAVLEGNRAKYEKTEKKLELNRAYIEDEARKRSTALACFALRREKLILAFNTLSAATLSEKQSLIEQAKNELISEMSVYNKACDDCSSVIGIPISLITLELADEIINGKTCINIPRLAVLKELVETVGEKSRTVGRCENNACAPSCTFVIKRENKPSKTAERTAAISKPRSGVKTVHGHFFIGGTYNGGTVNDGAGVADALLTGAIIAGPMIAANGGEGADPGASVAAALAFGTAAKSAGMPGVMSSVTENTSSADYENSVNEAVLVSDEAPLASEAVYAAAPLAADKALTAESAEAPTPEAIYENAPIEEVQPVSEEMVFEPAADDEPLVYAEAKADTEPEIYVEPEYEEPVTEPIYEEPITEPVYEEPVTEPIYEEPITEPVYEEPIPEEVFTEQPYSAPVFDVEKTGESSDILQEVYDFPDEEELASENFEAEEAVGEIPVADNINSGEELAGEASNDEAPIEEIAPKKLIKTVRDESGEEIVTEEPYTEELVDDGEGDDIYEADKTADSEMYDGPEPLDVTGEGEKDGKKLRLVPLPPPEGQETDPGEEGTLADGVGGPVYPGNVIEHSDSEKYIDPDDLSNLPPVIEIDGSADIAENEVLTNPTKRGLKKHLAYISKKIRKAEHERSRLNRLKRSEKLLVPKVKYIISILGVQKEIVDWYCNALTSACDVGVKGKIKRISRALRAELKRYNKFVGEYERITEDRLTRASLDIPACIIDGEDYQVIPKVKLREYEAPENGVVYDDGITEIADAAVDFTDNIILTVKDLKRRLSESSREISKLKSVLAKKNKEKQEIWGIEKTVLVAECFAEEKKIIDKLAADLHAACQVSSVKDIQSIKKDLSYEIKQYNRLVREYKEETGNNLTPASDSIAQDIISGRLYTPVAKVGCIHSSDSELDEEIRAMSNNTYGVEDNDIGEAGRAAFRTSVVSQANKDLKLITRRADYNISMLESERDMLNCHFGKESSEVKRERRAIAKLIEKIKNEHKSALRYENSDNRRYYAAVTANPRTMALRNKKADRTRVAALRSKIISLLNERDLINGKLMALYGGDGEGTLGSINQTYRRVKNNAAMKSKRKQKSFNKTVKALPITVKDKGRFYDLMNKKVDAESTLAVVKYRLKKGKLNKSDKLLAKRDIKEIKSRISRINKDIKDLLKSVKSRIAEVESGKTWIAAFAIVIIIALAGIAIYAYFFGDTFIQMLNAFTA